MIKSLNQLGREGNYVNLIRNINRANSMENIIFYGDSLKVFP